MKVNNDYPFVSNQQVKVTFITYGGAVYDRKGKIINSSWPGFKSIRRGIVEYHSCEALFRSVAVVKCKSTDPKCVLSTFTFYPQDIGNNLIVEIE